MTRLFYLGFVLDEMTIKLELLEELNYFTYGKLSEQVLVGRTAQMSEEAKINRRQVTQDFLIS